MSTTSMRSPRWMADQNVAAKEPLLLQYFLALPPQRGGHKATWAFVLERHRGSVQQLAQDWGVAFDSPAKFAEMHAKGMVLNSKAYSEDLDAFTTHFTREYFRITAECIRRYDPNHLLLGCRHGGPPGDVVLRAYDPRHVAGRPGHGVWRIAPDSGNSFDQVAPQVPV